ncbi:transglutaminase domain-containing protein [Streptomyces sp. NPDC047028]|uniref:transglutaminase domain-containing protein n=1 Tax=Streptomyces sp. NPDC047028 TaxID=3155793 RepID=UPI0033D433FB
MVSSLLMPRGQVRAVGVAGRAVPGGTVPTPVLDWEHPRVLAAVRSIGGPADGEPTVATLRRAHRWISAEVRPVYSVEEARPVSEVLRLGRGSCSQRMAALEAVARAWGVPTRVRGLVVDGTFWYPRFPRLRRLVPRQVLLAWPEFRVDGEWLPVSQLFAETAAARPTGGFTNSGTETLFEALSRTGIDWDGDGSSACPASAGRCDLSAHLRLDLGRFDSRDELFTRHGQTLCGTARFLAEPVLGRRAAGV